MEGFFVFLISLFLIMALISAISKKVVFPKWAKLKSTTSWGMSIFDNNKWVKVLLIKIFQTLVLLAILMILAFRTGINLAIKIMPVKIPKL